MSKRELHLIYISLLLVITSFFLGGICLKHLYSAQTWTSDCYDSSHSVSTDMGAVENNFLTLQSTFSGTSAPSFPVEGQLWYDSTGSSELLAVYDGASWCNIFDVANDRIYTDQVTTASILDATIATADIANSAITNVKIATGAVESSDILDETIVSADIDDGTIAEADLGASCVSQTKLKTSTGSASGSLSAGGLANITMQDYCFFPSITENGDGQAQLYAKATTDPSNTTAVFSFKNPDGSNSTTYTVRFRYITSTDKPFIYALVDKSSGELSALWECEDPPPAYWGLSEKPDDFVPPIEGPNLAKYDEIVIFNYPLKEFHALRKDAKKKGKSMFSLLKEEYKIVKNEKKFKKKEAIILSVD